MGLFRLRLNLDIQRSDTDGYLLGYIVGGRFVPLVDLASNGRVFLHGTELQVSEEWAFDARQLVQRWIAHKTMLQYTQEEALTERQLGES